MTNKAQHGGRRKGAGRPPKGETPMSRRVSVMLTPAQAEYLEALGGGNISEGIRIVIEQARQQAEK